MTFARTLVVLLVLTGLTACATEAPPASETSSAAPQLKPGEVKVRMNGRLSTYGGVSSNRP